jgi:hypothetical protein
VTLQTQHNTISSTLFVLVRVKYLIVLKFVVFKRLTRSGDPAVIESCGVKERQTLSHIDAFHKKGFKNLLGLFLILKI